MKVARISTVMFFLSTQLKKQISDLRSFGCDITIIANEDNFQEKSDRIENINSINITINRKISPVNDLFTLVKLIKIFKAEQFDIVHSTTPKAGLLVAIASWIARIPVRLHTFTGQPWINDNGIRKSLLMNCDRLIVFLNSKCYVDSKSQKQVLVSNKIAKENKLFVMGTGSIAGVDLKRFKIDKYSDKEKNELRKTLNILTSSFVLLFVGRVTKDKGIYELLLAFKELQLNGYDSDLIIVGPLEPEDKGDFTIFMNNYGISQDRIKFIGYSNEPEKYMAVSNLFCLPSYREGFGTVIIESAAMGIPSIGTNIYGLSDAIINEKTGLLVPVKDVYSLYDGFVKLIEDKNLYNKLSKNAFKRVISEFDSELISKEIFQDYKNLINIGNFV